MRSPRASGNSGGSSTIGTRASGRRRSFPVPPSCSSCSANTPGPATRSRGRWPWTPSTPWRGGGASGEAFYVAVAEDTLEYVGRDLTDGEGGFQSAEDADSVPPEEAGRP